MPMPSLALRFDSAKLSSQMEALRGRHPGLWPTLPRVMLLLAVFVGIVFVGWAAYWRGLVEELEAGEVQEQTLKSEWTDKIKLAVNLQGLRAQKEQITRNVSQLEKQLPSKAEMDALLSDINQAGVGRGAQLQQFRPGQVVVKEYYAELPIAVRVVGNYHDLGAFASDLANLPRIVTLNNLSVVKQENGSGLQMDATARTFRYLDPEEIAQQREAARKQAAGARK